MRLNILHRTHYTYERPVAYGLQELRLTPLSGPGQQVMEWSLDVAGGTHELEFTNEMGDVVSLLSFDGAGHEITVTARGIVETTDLGGVFGRHLGFMPLWAYRRSTELTRAGPLVRGLVRGLSQEEPEPIPRLHALMARVHEAVAYVTGRTDPATTAEGALEAGHGVCQDHAHIFCAAARMLGFPARYVSGYLLMDDRTDQEASHAWAEAHVEGLGWIGFDASNRISPDARYVRLATGFDYAGAAPVRGLRFGEHGNEALAVELQVAQ